jgi:pilus assembly protein Flp/PilA
MPKIDRILHDERGATAIEYGLIASLIVIAIIGSMNIFAAETTDMWNYVSGSMTNASS